MAEYRVTVDEGNGCLDQVGAGCTLVGCLGCAAILFGGIGTGAAASVGLIAALRKFFKKE